MAEFSKREKPVPLKRGMDVNTSNGSGSSDNKSNGNEEKTELQKSEKPQLPKRRKPAKDERHELPKRVMPKLPKDKKPEFPKLVMGDNEANGIESILNVACLSEISADNEEDATIVSKKEMSRFLHLYILMVMNFQKMESFNVVMPKPQKNKTAELQKDENVEIPTQKVLSEQLNVQ